MEEANSVVAEVEAEEDAAAEADGELGQKTSDGGG